jgi:hypothetical protein
VQVRITATAPVTNNLSGTISVATLGALSGTNVSLLGEVFPDINIPSITLSTNSLSGLGSVESSPGWSTNFTVSGSFLRGAINVSAPASLAVSIDNTNFGTNVSLLSDTNNTISNALVYVRISEFAPVSTNTNVFLGNLTLYTARNSNNLPLPTNVSVSGTVTNWSIANPYDIRVTNPAVDISTGAPSYIYSGQFGVGLNRSNLTWFNQLNSQSNSFVGNTDATWSVSVPLAGGLNDLLFSGEFSVVSGTTNDASDAAADRLAYSNGWSTGDNGGYGYGPWQLAAEDALSALYVTDSWSVTNMNVPTTSGINKGFALESISGGVATAYRPFAVPLQAPGGSFTVYFDSNDLQSQGRVGMSLVSSNKTPLFTFGAVNSGFAPAYAVSDQTNTSTDPGWPYTQTGLFLRFEMTSSNAYLLTATSATFTNNIIGTISNAPVAGVVFYSENAGAPPDHNFYLGQMMQFSTVYETQTVTTAAPYVERMVSPTSAYDAWAAGYGLDPAGGADPARNGSPAADPDNDSFSNDMEYAFGTSPVLPDSVLLDVMQSGGNMLVDFNARTNGVSYTVEQRGNLSAPSPGWVTSTNGITGPSRSADQSGVPHGYERRTFSAPATGENFYRVRANIEQ